MSVWGIQETISTRHEHSRHTRIASKQVPLTPKSSASPEAISQSPSTAFEHEPSVQQPPKPSSADASAPEGEAAPAPAGQAEEGESSGGGGAFNPQTGEINWDCPCLGGMAHGPCGMQFREAFSCFVFSEAEPKGIDCVEKFKAMQECFREHPDVYGDGAFSSSSRFRKLAVLMILVPAPQKSCGMTRTRTCLCRTSLCLALRRLRFLRRRDRRRPRPRRLRRRPRASPGPLLLPPHDHRATKSTTVARTLNRQHLLHHSLWDCICSTSSAHGTCI